MAAEAKAGRLLAVIGDEVSLPRPRQVPADSRSLAVFISACWFQRLLVCFVCLNGYCLVAYRYELDDHLILPLVLVFIAP